MRGCLSQQEGNLTRSSLQYELQEQLQIVPTRRVLFSARLHRKTTEERLKTTAPQDDEVHRYDAIVRASTSSVLSYGTVGKETSRIEESLLRDDNK